MLMFAHLLTHSHAWRERRIRLLHAVPTEQEREELLPAFEELIATSRVRAQPHIVVSDDIAASVARHSGAASLVLLGMDQREAATPAGDWHEDIRRISGELDEVILVCSVGDVRLGN